MLKKTLQLLSILLLAGCIIASARQTESYEIKVSLDKGDWTYEQGDIPQFSVAVMSNDTIVSGLPLNYACGPETLEPTLVKSVKTASETIKINAGTMKVPGFLRCTFETEADGKKYSGVATAAFRPDLIKPIVKDPADFLSFWRDEIARASKIELDPKMELLPDKSTAKVNVYKVNFQTIGTGFAATSRIYGILAIPKTSEKGKKFPAVLRVPGAGVRPYNGQIALAERGLITLEVGIHGIPVDLPADVYESLRAGALNRYMLYNLDNRDTYYYKRVYLGMLRALDMLASLKDYNGNDLAVMGGSQGGALAIMAAALDERVKYLAASYPALSDMEGYTANRAGGWPHMFKDASMRTKEKMTTAAYYDVVNFARRLKVPGFYTLGFNDTTCPPTSMYAGYNVINAPKELMVAVEMGHANSPKQQRAITDWLEKKLKRIK